MEVKFYKDENADAFYVRRKVFVEEQNIPECDEFDGSDIGVIQAVVYDNNSPVATGRLIKVENEMRIGRVAVLKEYRGTGTGKLLMNSLLEKAKECGYKEIIVHAQTQALGFYGSLGFEEYGEVYIEDKILHKSMKKELHFNHKTCIIILYDLVLNLCTFIGGSLIYEKEISMFWSCLSIFFK